MQEDGWGDIAWADRWVDTERHMDKCNGFSPKIVRKSPDLRIFTEIRILRIHLSDFDDFFPIGSIFAFRARCRTPFPADFAKNAVSENLYCQIFREIFVLTFAKIRKHSNENAMENADNYSAKTSIGHWHSTTITTTTTREQR